MSLEADPEPHRPAESCHLSFIVPAHDEAPTLGSVVVACAEAIQALDLTSEIVVVSDCSTDNTVQVATDQGARVVERRASGGSKAEALRLGVEESRGEFLFFVDADLIGLTGRHLMEIARPVLHGETLMAVGTFDYVHGGRLVQRIPWSTGERILPRRLFPIDDPRLNGYNVELLLNEAVGRQNGRTASFRMDGVRQRSKVQKIGRFGGMVRNLAMWQQIAETSADIDLRSYLRYARNVSTFEPSQASLESQSGVLTTASCLALLGAARAIRMLAKG